MKTIRIALAAGLLTIAIILGYQLRLTREELITVKVQSQIERIKSRALAFYQFELGRKTLDHEFIGSNSDFELQVVMPKGKEAEFKAWMMNYDFDLSFLRQRNLEYFGHAEVHGKLSWKLKYE